MSKQLAFSAAASIMAMAVFVLYGPSLAQHVGAVSLSALNVPQLTGFKALLPS